MSLLNLNDVSLEDNDCIDRSYRHKEIFKTMMQEISQQCGFDDPTDTKHSNESKKKSSMKIWLIILVVALVIVLMGIGVYLKYFHIPMRYF